ncbi:MAG: SLBB domain-containing protein, partial [Spirochaetales bacterium]|nr:SLBB domain-containing protein [Spirochaetales bacterium]
QLVPLERATAVEERLLLAVSSPNYRVTPGDVYRLSFLLGNEPVTNEILVESDYTLNLNIFGKVNAENMTFAALKPVVEKRIADAYPRSLPSLNIVSVGVFQVLMRGEIAQTMYVTAWGLSRLSNVVQDQLGPYSSLREIGIISRDGTLRRYDLFKALHLGIVDQDPYVRPGDVIVVYRRDREVELLGEVYRPGSYQLLKEHGLRELIGIYGRGTTNRADTSRIRLQRYAEPRAQTVYLDFSSGFEPSLELRDGDVVTVPSRPASLPVVFFEGAVLPPPDEATVVLAEAEEVGVESYNRIAYPFVDGESLLDAYLAVKDSVSASADLSRAYVVREGVTDPIAVNLQRLTFDYRPSEDLALQAFDRVVIPSLRFTVSILGAVERAGVYPYVPNRTYSYYLSLAGGIPPGETAEYISILDSEDRPRALDAVIQPEDRIVVSASLISVAGAVYAPGSYPFVPGRTYRYYVDLAGGIDPERNKNGKITIVDPDGNNLKPDRVITPGDRIFVESNDFTYNFNRYFPVITAGVAFISTIIGIIGLLVD